MCSDFPSRQTPKAFARRSCSNKKRDGDRTRSHRALEDLQVFRRGFAAVFHEVIFHGLIFIEGRESGALDRRDVDEHVLLAGGRLDEPIALGRVEPLDGTLGHRLSPALDANKQTKKDAVTFPRATPQTGLRKSCSIS